MAIGNLGATMNLLRGYLASEFGTPNNQGASLLPEMVERVASRADLTYTNLRVTKPVLFDGTNPVTVESGAVGVIAVVAQTLAAQAEDAAVLLYEASPTIGTTRYTLALNVDAAGTAATAKMGSAVFPEPIPMAALYWAISDNGANGDIEGANPGDASGVRVMLVYAE